MDLARALTKRNKRPEGLFAPARAFSTRKHDGSVNHDVISSPVELISATNALAYDAPALYPASDSESQMSSLPSSRDTTPETSSIECAPSPIEENHLTGFFRNPGAPLSPKASVRRSNSSGDGEAPSFATRMRSQLRKSTSTASPTPATPDVAPANDTPAKSSQGAENGHPFSGELAKVTELAEEIGGRDVLALDEDEQYLASYGLHRWVVDDYVDDLTMFFGDNSMNPFGPPSSPWI